MKTQTTRREFIKKFGIALASLLASGCAPDLGGRSSPTSTAEPTIPPGTPRQRLRANWQQFNALALATREDVDAGSTQWNGLLADHRAALDDLVAEGAVTEEVAHQVQVGFEAATYHIWRANAPMTCYEPAMIDYKPASSAQLAEQGSLLAARQDLDPETVAQAQTAIARDIAFLTMSKEEMDTLYNQLFEAQQSGQPIPIFAEVDLEVAPEDLEAALFLLDVLLGITQ